MIKRSNYHIIIEPKGNNFDRYLIHDVVKEYAKSKSLNVIFKKNREFKLVLINNLDNLSFCAQAALRRTMERYNDKCRFIMLCRSLSKVIDPLQSRTVFVRVPSPTDNEIFSYMMKISALEQIKMNLEEYYKIIKSTNGNIKMALWNLQFKKYGYEFNTEYVNSLHKIVDLLYKCNPGNMKNIRNIFFDLMITNYTGITILKDLINVIFDDKRILDITKQKIIQKSSDTEYRLLKSRREIIHFDAFVLSCMKYIRDDLIK
jgi:replication factor C subunit 3/5